MFLRLLEASELQLKPCLFQLFTVKNLPSFLFSIFPPSHLCCRRVPGVLLENAGFILSKAEIILVSWSPRSVT